MSSPPVPSSDHIADRRAKWFIGSLLAMQAMLGMHAAWRLTVTHDEYWHLPVGLLTCKTGRFDFDAMNPPLTRVWCAAPLLLIGAEIGAVEPGAGPGEVGNAFHTASGERYR